MDKQTIANLLKEQLDQIPAIKELNPDDPIFQLWKDNCLTYFKEFFPEEKRWIDSFNDWPYYVNRIKFAEEVGIFTEEDKTAFLEGLQGAEVTIKAALKKLEIFGIKPQDNEVERTDKGITIKIINNLSNEQTVNTMITFEQIKKTVLKTQASDQDKEKTIGYIEQVEEEIKKDNPSWEKIKPILEWLLNFSRDAFLQLLPYIIGKFPGSIS